MITPFQGWQPVLIAKPQIPIIASSAKQDSFYYWVSAGRVKGNGCATAAARPKINVFLVSPIPYLGGTVADVGRILIAQNAHWVQAGSALNA